MKNTDIPQFCRTWHKLADAVCSIYDLVDNGKPKSVGYWDSVDYKYKVIKNLNFSKGVLNAIKELNEELGDRGGKYEVVYAEGVYTCIVYVKDDNTYRHSYAGGRELVDDCQLLRCVVDTMVHHAINRCSIIH